MNGSTNPIESSISGEVYEDKWKYVHYENGECSYSCRCGKKGCDTCYRDYKKYRWELQSRKTVPFRAEAKKLVRVSGATAWLKTNGAGIHINNGIDMSGKTDANIYNLNPKWHAIGSPPNMYTPPGRYNADYFITAPSGSRNLRSKRGLYADGVFIEKSHGFVYSREENPRNFYDDLLKAELFGKVTTRTETVLSDIHVPFNEIYYYP